MVERAIRVIDPGMHTTVQDLGRAGWTHVGVPRGGACDTHSLRAGNRLLGNEDGAAALEMTLVGGTFEFLSEAVVVIAGARVDARWESDGKSRTASPWTAMNAKSGDRLAVGPLQNGARCYLCVGGGVEVPPVLDSRSTCLAAHFGGLQGRALKANDHIPLGKASMPIAPSQFFDRAKRFFDTQSSRRVFRATNGAHGELFDSDAVEHFWSSTFQVKPQSNRAGLRLEGTIDLHIAGLDQGRMPSEGMMHGAVQIPESGNPIVLMADHPTTGGYPVIACVCAADLPALGQVAPMESIRFEKLTISEARGLYLEQQRVFDIEVPRHG